MHILSIETSCDETAVAVTKNGRQVLSSEISSQVEMHRIYGGVVPELASRRHIQVITPLAEIALEKSGITRAGIDAVAVTYAPGLIGALLVGVNFAKSAALTLDVPLIPVHHIRGHIAANYIAYPELTPPFLALVVSGGHSLLVDVRGYTDMKIIGTTRDDAAGECFDKTARVLGLGYPGGPAIDALAKNGDEKKYALPVSKINDSPFDMSFSGLKTAVINLVHNSAQSGNPVDREGLAASICRAISDTLVPRAISACKSLGYSKICCSGGVAANSVIRRDLSTAAAENNLEIYLAPLSLCSDNAAMIGCQGYYEYLSGNRADSSLNAYATMPVDKLV
ncbi:MAG: tRNA (adenosine(37)-N6)-threonylcarbamoyltransferase complex transferase subunit TsaD [Clostridiales bacterium]|jgi:N6-L-threonylcarbamoyladenine synthase|nr:tRNA (adenosine(37)-N6)-threonylcarbamoyltransferase complex transferase subunit TsaD [Clostridiales bacterium]